MSYTAQFKNINNILYQIDITTNSDNTITELILTNEPFRVDVNSDILFSPLKLSNATCTIVSNDYLFDLYSSTAQGVKVTLTNINDNKIEWVGYTTPNLYTQSYEKEYEIIELELIDGISTLEYFEYSRVNINNSGYISFIELLIDSIKLTNCYSNIYINKNLNVLNINTYNNIIEYLFIHENNFIDIEKNATYKSILNNILEFLNFTLIVQGNSVYIMDYNYINVDDKYTLYSTTNNWNTYSISTSTLNHNYTVTKDSFKLNGGTISLLDTKNKASIEVQNEIVEDIIPDLFDDTLLTNITFENGVDNSYYKKVIDDFTYIIRFVRNDKFKDINHIYNSGIKTYTETPLNYYDSVILKNAINFGGSLRQIATYKNNEVPSKLSFTNYVCMKRWFNTMDAKIELPMYKYISNDDVALLYDDYYFLIDLQINHDQVFDSYFPKEDTVKANPNSTELLANGMHIPFKIQIGNKYWNGTSWGLTDTKFNVEFDLKGSKKLFNIWYPVTSNIYYYNELNGSGLKIPISKSDYLVGNPIVTIYSPVYTTVTYSSFIGTIWMKDFNFQLVKKDNILGVRKEDTNTIYQNVINDSFINEFDSISLKLNTDVDKGLSYTSVLVKNDSNNYQLLENIKSTSNSNINQKQEYNIIQNYVDFYSYPKKELILTLQNIFKPYSKLLIDGEYYFIDKYVIDYFNDNAQLTLVKN